MTRRPPNRRPDPGGSPGWALALAALLTAGAAVLLVWAAAALASPAPVVAPLTYPLRLATGQAAWPAGAGLILAGLVALLAAAAAAGGLAWRRATAGRSRVDDRAASLATSRDLAPLTPQAASRDADRLGAAAAGPGVPLGRAVRDGRELLASWESVQLTLIGPRMAKTSCLCIPQTLSTAGPVVTTSNKRDLVDATRGPRSEIGAVWVHDPQQVIGEPATWWWNPLSCVTDVKAADELAALFALSGRDQGARTDAYFEPRARELLSGLLLAAAADDRPLLDVYGWLTRPDDTEPADLLRGAGHRLSADAVLAVARLTPKQRDGVVDTALQFCAWMRHGTTHPWVAAGGAGDERPHFDVDRFVRSRDTLHLVSREGHGTARALTAALTVAVMRAAEASAARSPAGRLPVPLLAVLDEAANVCRWPELPDLYSHYGSRGIVVSTYLQSWSQGVEVWGETGMRKLWSSAAVRLVGAGLAEDEFLERVSRLVGDRDVVARSTSDPAGGRGGSRTVSTSLRRERTLDVADLAALPRDRAVLLSAGRPPALLELVHWSRTPEADAIRASEACYGPAAPQPAAGARTATGGSA